MARLLELGIVLPALMLAAIGLVRSAQAQADSKSYAVMLNASIQSDPPAIALSWDRDSNATEYTVSRRAGLGWVVAASLDAETTWWTDTNVTTGSAVEYRVLSSTSAGFHGTGYILAGIQAPLVDDRGKVLLVVDGNVAPELENELRRFEWDLAGEGWRVQRLTVSRSAPVTEVKQQIVSAYLADPLSVRAVVLLGRVPVPYSGDFSPDGHSDHRGAWPADAYYGDVDGVWTDLTARSTNASDPRNRNIPGDGKFDQSQLPSDVELAVGRIDFSNLPCFEQAKIARTEIDLLRAYLNKNHDFRHRAFSVTERGLIADFFGPRRGEAFASSGWRNFAPLLGARNISEAGPYQFFTKASEAEYLWAYACGGGSFQTIDNVGSSFDFTENEIKSVFTMFVGSYFGDWDYENAFLRAALGSGNCLTTSWAGRPHWFYHRMGLGEPIGSSILASQNNRSSGPYGPAYNGTRGVHVSLLGDPTLRMHPVAPVQNLQAMATENSTVLAWEASPDPGVVGYHVYRGIDPGSAFVRITEEVVSTTSFTDSAVEEPAVYMVRAVKLQHTPSGSFFNASQGVFQHARPEAKLVRVPASPANLVAKMLSPRSAELKWEHRTLGDSFKVERRTESDSEWTVVNESPEWGKSYRDTTLRPGTKYSFRVRASNSTGVSAPSNLATGTTFLTEPAPAAATFLGADQSTRGNWSGVFGTDGYWVLPGNAASAPPPYLAMSVERRQEHYWSTATLDNRAPQRPNSTTRMAGCWYAFNWFAVDLTSLDDQSHKVSMYFVDWDRLGRSQRLDLVEIGTGKLLDSRTISNFGDGLYLSWEVRGAVQVRLTVLTGGNAVLSGIYFDPVAIKPAPAPAALSARKHGGKVTLKINGEKAEEAEVMFSEDLRTWSNLGVISLQDGSTEFVDDTAEQGAIRFYRVVPVK